ncbi:hypothetical protein HPB49_017631 [Dermacentor silvarum]|uniref:Uncharacterized protein n=1 Tax=Dermacentor silvarum TaxID=543639 RepID=A0ACB8CYW2_DERSI|nr:hypothetical protein HPB49_017631 [Dermacentor silvarum]
MLRIRVTLELSAMSVDASLASSFVEFLTHVLRDGASLDLASDFGREWLLPIEGTELRCRSGPLEDDSARRRVLQPGFLRSHNRVRQLSEGAVDLESR